MPNFTLLDLSRPEIAGLLAAMLQACSAVQRRSWSQPQEPTGEEWLADVLADPRVHTRSGPRDFRVKQAFYRLRDEPRATILIACSKCDWKAAFSRDDLIGSYGTEYLMTDLLSKLASPTCSKVGQHWDRCGAYYIKPIDR
jgi:hypothetical protein